MKEMNVYKRDKCRWNKWVWNKKMKRKCGWRRRNMNEDKVKNADECV